MACLQKPLYLAPQDQTTRKQKKDQIITSDQSIYRTTLFHRLVIKKNPELRKDQKMEDPACDGETCKACCDCTIFNETLIIPFNYREEQHTHIFCHAVRGCSEETIYYLRQLIYKYDLGLDRFFNPHDNVHKDCFKEEWCRNEFDKYKRALFSIRCQRL